MPEYSGSVGKVPLGFFFSSQRCYNVIIIADICGELIVYQAPSSVSSRGPMRKD